MSCVAVGGDGTVVSTDDGGVTWSLDPVPDGTGELVGVTCPTVHRCFATGRTTANGGLVLQWDDGSDPSSGLRLATSTTSSGYGAAGQVIALTDVVSNTGTTTLSDVSVTDDLTSDVTCPSATLSPGASENCTASYEVTQAAVDTGSATDMATASATGPGGDTVTSNASVVSVPANATVSSVSVATSSTTPGYSAPGQTLWYRYQVTDTGTTTLHGITVDDDFARAGCPPTVAPGVTVVCGDWTSVTPADVTAGSVTNTATATATDPFGQVVTSAPSSTTILGPAITSGAAATASSGSAFVFSVTTQGAPTPAVTKSGALPRGLHFVQHHNGTATVQGRPTKSGVGTYHLVFSATYGKGRAAVVVTQPFTLTVVADP